VSRIAKIATGARVHGGYEHEVSRESGSGVGTSNGDGVVF